MASTSRKSLNAEEFFRFIGKPENNGRSFELDRGKVVEAVPDDDQQRMVAMNVCAIFGLFTLQHPGSMGFFQDGRLIVDDDPATIFKPDLAFFLEVSESMGAPDVYPKIAPNAVIEVLRQRQSWSALMRRLIRVLKGGAASVWLVHPEEKAVVIWWSGQHPLVFDESQEIADIPALPGFRCKVSEIFNAPGA